MLAAPPRPTRFRDPADQEQARAIGYLLEETPVLWDQLGKRLLRLGDDQRRRLAVKGRLLGRKALTWIATLVTPDTILRWHRRLIAAKWTYSRSRRDRPGLMKHIRKLIVEMAADNPSWGYLRIQGELKKVGHTVAKSTIAPIPETLGSRTRASPHLLNAP